MSGRLRLVFHPVPEVGRIDTSLRYTDILFGFVIRELFLRLQNWPLLDRAAQWHLAAGTVLVLGSWIGYRRSLNRSAYEVKFFNLPLLRFVIDQLMLILYFRIAVLTSTDISVASEPSALLSDTTRLVLYVFLLYFAWDVLGIWMATAKVRTADGRKTPRYPLVRKNDKSEMTSDPQPIDWAGFLITTFALTLLVALWLLSVCYRHFLAFPALIPMLLGYRWAKEIRTSWRRPQPA